MEEQFNATNRTKIVKTYSKVDKTAKIPLGKYELPLIQVQPLLPSVLKREPLTTKNAVKFLLQGSLKRTVCRYCLHVAPQLSELDQILQVADKGTIYKVSLKDMIASFHPFKVVDNPDLPAKICTPCVDRTISSYLFTQQCERAERAIRNCFDDIYEKFDKLDPLDRPKKARGRQKQNPNSNILHAEHEKVIDYADPIMHIVNTATESLTTEPDINQFECLKCSEVLPNQISLLNHKKMHPKSMWYNCRLCGKSFPKDLHFKKHWRKEHKRVQKAPEKRDIPKYSCNTCGLATGNYYENLQHLEKHKFKIVMEHLIDRNMDKLCSICLNKESNMLPLHHMVSLHGGCPELTGDRPFYKILATTLPEMNLLDNYTGTKVCEKCLSHAITSYVFINQSYFVRNRLSTCVSVMVENLNKIPETENNICIEIAQSAIMNVTEPFEENLLSKDDIGKQKFNVEVLEDEFRLQSESESDTETESIKVKHEQTDKSNIKNVNKHNNTNNTLMNGYKLKKSVCSNFLKFKKKPKFSCPLCNKHFISDYFFKRHILKHKPKKVECNVCDFQFKSKFHLYEHKKMCHLMKKSVYLSCKVCGRCYIDEEKLKYHGKHHLKQFCQLCDKTFKTLNCYISHMHRHMVKLGVIMRKYIQNCGFCEKDCANDNEFSLHVNRSHLQIKPYSCDMCEQYFYTEQNLNSHKIVHRVRKKEQCNFCDKTLNSRKQLVIHIRKHIGDTPFFCQICGVSFYSEFRLSAHMNLCHGGRFFCKFCKSTFSNRKQLKEHINKTHNSFVFS